MSKKFSKYVISTLGFLILQLSTVSAVAYTILESCPAVLINVGKKITLSNKVRQEEYQRAGELVGEYVQKVLAHKPQNQMEKKQQKKLLKELGKLNNRAIAYPDHIFAITFEGEEQIKDFKQNIFSDVLKFHQTYPYVLSSRMTAAGFANPQKSPFAEIDILNKDHHSENYLHYKFTIRANTLKMALDENLREFPKSLYQLQEHYVEDIQLKVMSPWQKFLLKLKTKYIDPEMHEYLFDEREVHFYYIQQVHEDVPHLTVIIATHLDEK
ncbi:MAG: hypothetical protein KDD40_02805 [Bdellovibrionales bacterium]|nr:hypothetical protein [Bdellovibrionales bacterium]